MNEVFGIVFGILMAMVMVWFGLLKAIFNRLEKNHSEKYEEMGKPSVFWNSSMKTAYATLKLIVKREHVVLGSPGLSKLCDFALVFFVVYLILFFGLFFSVAVPANAT